MNVPRKRIRIKNLHNFRDLGGYETGQGQIVEWNKLFRSDGLATLEQEQWEQIRDMGIRSVVDLRSKSEVLLYPDKVIEKMKYCHCPLQREEIDIDDVKGAAKRAFSKSMSEGYLMMLNDETDLIAAAVNTIIEGLREGAVLFHCTAGKDRTGTLAAILYSLLGVAREDIIADYQVSHTYNETGLNLMIKKAGKYEEMKSALVSVPDYIEPLLNKLDTIDIEQVLMENGVTKENLSRFRAEMLRDIIL